MFSDRPKVRIRSYIWRTKEGTETHGIAVLQQGHPIAHYTAAEGRAMADRIHDLCDQEESRTA